VNATLTAQSAVSVPVVYVNELVEDVVGLPSQPPAIADTPGLGVTVNVFVSPYNPVWVVLGLTVPSVPVTATVTEYVTGVNATLTAQSAVSVPVVYVNELVEDVVGLPSQPPAIADTPGLGVTVNVFVSPDEATCVVLGLTVPPVPVTEMVTSAKVT